MNNLEADLYCDGASKGNPGPSAIGIRLLNTKYQTIIGEKSTYLGETTNNAAEYVGLIQGLLLAQQYGVSRINVYLDSMLIVKHITGEYKVRNSRLEPLYKRTQDLLELFGDGYTINHIPRAKNARADELANSAIRRHAHE